MKYVRIDKIKIPYNFLVSGINREKYRAKKKYFNTTGEYESMIVLDKDNRLIDGYTSYVIAVQHDLGKVPVCYEWEVEKPSENTD